MGRKVNSLNIASGFLPHVPPGKTTYCLISAFFPSHMHFWAFFFFF